MNFQEQISNYKTSAIVVLYNPNLDNLIYNLSILIKQIDELIIVDNSSINNNDFLISNLNYKNLIYYFNNNNIGIAKAQNIGVRLSKNNNFLFLLDQDSCPSDNMINKLIIDFISLKSKGFNLAAIGPTAINIFVNKPYSPRFKKYKEFIGNNNVYNVSELISSGMLIDKKRFLEIGYFNEILFIDGVDHEWCWRAINKGFCLGLSKSCKLSHSLGEGDKFIFGFRVAISSSFRIYYQYRNFIYLSNKNYVPFYWKLNNFVKYIIKYFYYPFFVSKSYTKRIHKGIYDGFKLIKDE